MGLLVASLLVTSPYSYDVICIQNKAINLQYMKKGLAMPIHSFCCVAIANGQLNCSPPAFTFITVVRGTLLDNALCTYCSKSETNRLVWLKDWHW